MPKTMGQYIAADLPERDDDSESDLISLVDIVITGVETPWRHFWVEGYDPEADGKIKAWAKLLPLKDAADPLPDAVLLTSETVRKAVAAYLDSRLEAGMRHSEATRLVDGSYTDAVIADSILQFALYGEEVYN